MINKERLRELIEQCDINNIYETKEEAEFAAKNHDTRIEKFEPPFELNESKFYEFVSKNNGIVTIHKLINANYYSVYTNCYSINKNFDTYQEALDYAHKIFKGEN